jgi:hypothetical protein
MGAALSPELAPRVRALDDGVRLRLAKLIVARCPHMRQNDVLRYAEVCVQIVKGLLLALHGSASKRRAGTREMKLVLERYLAPIEAEERGKADVKQPREASGCYRQRQNILKAI